MTTDIAPQSIRVDNRGNQEFVLNRRKVGRIIVKRSARKPRKSAPPRVLALSRLREKNEENNNAARSRLPDNLAMVSGGKDTNANNLETSNDATGRGIILEESTLFPPIRKKKVNRINMDELGNLISDSPRTSNDESATKLRKRGPKKLNMPFPPKFAIYRKLGLLTDVGKYCKRTYKADNDEQRNTYQRLPERDKRKINPGKERTRSYNVADSLPVNRRRETDPAFSIRQKIEQFKQWHEEQYQHKLENLNLREAGDDTKDVDIEDKDENGNEPMTLANLYREYSKRKAQEGRKVLVPGDETNVMPLTAVGGQTSLPKLVNKDVTARAQLPETGQGTLGLSRDNASMAGRAESPPAPVPEQFRVRQVSAKSWKTWRDVDESYAYTNVDRYIKDNELMSDEKCRHITDWVRAVDRARIAGESTDLGVPPLGRSLPQINPHDS